MQGGEELQRVRTALGKTGISLLVTRKVFGIDRRLQRLVDGMRGRLALEDDAAEPPEADRLALRPGRLADADARSEIFVQTLEPRRRVHRIAERRVLHFEQQRTEIPD